MKYSISGAELEEVMEHVMKRLPKSMILDFGTCIRVLKFRAESRARSNSLE